MVGASKRFARRAATDSPSPPVQHSLWKQPRGSDASKWSCAPHRPLVTLRKEHINPL